MTISLARKRLGPRQGGYTLFRDTDGNPMILTPSGRVFRIFQLRNSRDWMVPSMEPEDTAFFVEAANLLRDKERAEQAKSLEVRDSEELDDGA